MLAYVAPLMAAGKIKYREDIRQGLETIPKRVPAPTFSPGMLMGMMPTHEQAAI
jgi:NADPH-dependent curcumin reductase CurA